MPQAVTPRPGHVAAGPVDPTRPIHVMRVFEEFTVADGRSVLSFRVGISPPVDTRQRKLIEDGVDAHKYEWK